MSWRHGILITMLSLAATTMPAGERPMEPLSAQEMADTRIDEAEAAEDRDEISKDEVEELQQYLRDQPLSRDEVRPPPQRNRQNEDDGLTPFQQDFRDALRRATEENRR